MLVDTHAHLDLPEFDADREAVLDRARQAGVGAIVCPALHAASSEAVVRLAASGENLFAAVGIQPNYCAEARPGDWERVVALAAEPRVVAIGETGLDRHWDFAPLALQQDFFGRHLRLAHERNLPLVIHCRDAEAEVLAMLREAAGWGPVRGVLHAFSGDSKFAEQLVALGLYISFAGSVSYTNKKFELLRQAAAAVPEDRILVETDSPYLVPHALRGKEKRNEPAHLLLTAQALAELRGQTLDALVAQTTANARQLFAFE